MTPETTRVLQQLLSVFTTNPELYCTLVQAAKPIRVVGKKMFLVSAFKMFTNTDQTALVTLTQHTAKIKFSGVALHF